MNSAFTGNVFSGTSGGSGYSGYSGFSGFSGYSGVGNSGFSGFSSSAASAGYVAVTAFSSPPATTSTITLTTNLTGTIKKGYPIKYRQGGVDYYAVTTDITASLLTIAGPALNTGSALQALSYGQPELAQEVAFFVAGTFADAANTTLLADDSKTFFKWGLGPGYLVRFHVRAGTNDTGSNQPRVNVDVASSPVSTSNSNAGLALTSGWADSAVDISSSNYDIAYGDSVEVRVDGNGSNGDAQNLTVSCTFVLDRTS